MDPSRIEMVLVRPWRPANVASACRAMKNMGLSRLCLVGPPAGLGDPDARALAYGAWDVLDGARVAESLAQAVEESTMVAGTTGRDVEGAWSPRRLAAEVEERSGGGSLSVVFGPEASGLTSAELALCHVQVHAPTSADHASLNLAQAVLLVSYELRLGAKGVGPRPPVADRATAGEIEQAIQDLRGALLEVGYLDPVNPDHILAELRGMLARARPTRREVSLVRGVARQVSWAGRIARGRSPAS